MRTKNLFISILFFSLLLFSVKSYGVPYPDRIQWNASPNTFIISLYQGVLGRSPESQQVVNTWASNLNNRSLTKIQIFWRFINSTEYMNSRWSREAKNYSVIYRYMGKYNNSKEYFVINKNAYFTGHRQAGGPYAYGVATALHYYYQSIEDTKSNSNGINLFDEVPTVTNLINYRGNNGTTYSFQVTGTNQGSVWGGSNSVYTDDSVLGKAAVHAGLLNVGQSRILRVTILPGLNGYTGNTKNGISTTSYGKWSGSFRFE